MHEREKEFLKNFKNLTGKTLLYEPVTFTLNIDGVPCKYRPDFYSTHLDIFYEVVGSRQAFQQSKFKISALRKQYPHIILEVVTPDCKQYNYKSLKYYLSQPDTPASNLPRKDILAGLRFRQLTRQQLIDAMDKFQLCPSATARRIGIRRQTLDLLIESSNRIPQKKTAKKIRRFLEYYLYLPQEVQ